MLDRAAGGLINDRELEEHALEVATAIIAFQEIEEMWKATTEEPKSTQNAAKPEVEVFRDLSGRSSTLCAALAHLLHMQRKHGQDQTIINLTRDWEAAAKITHRDINERLRELTGTENLDDAIPNEKDWIGSWHLGAGSFGRAPMDAQLSNTGSIINRVVAKECDFNRDKDTRDTWDNDPSFSSKNDNKVKVPTEVLTMFDLRGKKGSEYVVKILNWRIATKRRLYRLYLEVSVSVWHRWYNSLMAFQYVDPRKILQKCCRVPPVHRNVQVMAQLMAHARLFVLLS